MSESTSLLAAVESLPSAPRRPAVRGLTKSRQDAAASLAETALVAVAVLRVDEAYQRRAKPQVIAGFAKQFVLKFCGFILVNIRADGSMWILDGQTRRAVCELLGIREMKAEIVRGLTQAEEAELYLLRSVNIQKPPRDTFRARVTAGRPEAVLLDAILTRVGLVTPEGVVGVRHGKAQGVIKCIAMLEKCLREEAKKPTLPENYTPGYFLESALRLILETWGNGERALSQNLIPPMHQLLMAHDEELVRPSFVEKLGAYDLDIIHSEARTIMYATTPKPLLRTVMLRKIVDLYNAGRQTKRIRFAP